MDDFGLDGGLGIAAPEAPNQSLWVSVIGYRWVASRGQDACPQCAALHGKEFYYNPGPGQASVDEMPKGRLHPNCGCTAKPITELKIPFVSNPKPKLYMLGKVEARSGFLVRLPGLKSRGIAPVYGRYGGDFWTGGRDISNDAQPDPHAYDAPGDDDMDEIFKDHDLCYDVHGRDCIECDRKLYKDFNKLHPDPRNWANPPETQQDIEYAKRYRSVAMMLFYGKIKAAELENAFHAPVDKDIRASHQAEHLS
ncbi:MAG: hypothetical protein V1806_05690 [Pseudomonadota bacterium]